jgi:hypothetical protein
MVSRCFHFPVEQIFVIRQSAFKACGPSPTNFVHSQDDGPFSSSLLTYLALLQPLGLNFSSLTSRNNIVIDVRQLILGMS